MKVGISRKRRVGIQRRYQSELASNEGRKGQSQRCGIARFGNDILHSPVLAPEELYVYRQMFGANFLAPLGAIYGFCKLHGAPLERSPHREFKAIDI